MAMAETMRKSRSTDTVAEQVIRSATSAGANYREAKRARSKAEFISKTTIALQEMEETRYWLELIERRHLAEVTKLLDEADQLLRLLSASISTAKRNNHR